VDHSQAIDFLIQADPALARLIDQVGPCRLAQSQEQGDLLATLASAIVYQQLSGKAAATIFGRFLALYPGCPFPSPQQILDTPDDQLRAVGLSGQKGRYLKDLALQVQQGLPSLEQLELEDDEAIIRALTRVKGIGRWTVQMLLIFRLGRPDVWPVDDLGIRAGVRKLYGLEAMPDKKEMERVGEPWRPYRSIASWYLWRSLELK
jgi:DNA-3-methyladenine glycosylase II